MAAAGAFYSASAEKVNINGLGGKDLIAAGNGLAALTQLTVEGGTGNDTINGGLRTVRPQQRHQTGMDTLRFNGANISENIDVSANGGRVRFTRDIAAITMDLDDVETVAYNALGGADTVNVHDLSCTDVKTVAVDLANPPGSGTGDGSADRIIVSGTNGADNIAVTKTVGIVRVRGLAATVAIMGAEAANDRLEINTLIGVDWVRSQLIPADIQLFVNGNPARSRRPSTRVATGSAVRRHIASTANR